MKTDNLEDYANLTQDNIDPELLDSALTMQHVSKLIAYGGSKYRRASDEDALQPQQFEAFLARAVEHAKGKTFQHS